MKIDFIIYNYGLYNFKKNLFIILVNLKNSNRMEYNSQAEYWELMIYTADCYVTDYNHYCFNK